MAKQAAEAGKPLAEVLRGQCRESHHIQSVQLDDAGCDARQHRPAQPTLSPVIGMAGEQPVTVSGAGDDFMQAVFDLEVGPGRRGRQSARDVRVRRACGQRRTDATNSVARRSSPPV